MNKCFAIFGTMLILATSLTSCISKKEFMLRKKEIEAKANHPASYKVVELTGPFEMKEGAVLTAFSPTQPWKNTDIPNGPEVQKAVIRDVLTGAVIGYAFYRIGRGTHTTNNNTTNNNYPEAAPAD